MRLEAEVINWAIRIKIYDKSDQSEELCADFTVTLSSKDTSVIQNWFCISAVQSFADVCLHVVTVYQASKAIWKICEANCKMLTGGHLTFWTLKKHQTCPLHPSCVLYLHPLICALFLLLLFLHPFFQFHIFKQWPVRQPLLNTGLQTELAVLLEDYIRAHLRKLCTGCYFHNPQVQSCESGKAVRLCILNCREDTLGGAKSHSRGCMWTARGKMFWKTKMNACDLWGKWKKSNKTNALPTVNQVLRWLLTYKCINTSGLWSFLVGSLLKRMANRNHHSLIKAMLP